MIHPDDALQGAIRQRNYVERRTESSPAASSIRTPERRKSDCWDEEESRAGRAILRRYEECSESEHESSSESEHWSNSELEEESNSWSCIEEQEEEESNSE